jgi:hypothetical protein
MNLYELSYAKIIILRDDIAEVIINDDVVMNVVMVKHYHEFLRTHLTSPFSLLINKINSYTYDFDAQLELATIAEINVMAVVAYNRITELTTESLASYPRSKKWNLEVFLNRKDALAWLISEQEKLTEK